ncbi:hypothetical protein FIE12Z_7384 [Fusarium flagelliforme]|uniref:Uncharacterized protein n=1 Tax=Fusarium flagelliforme TaxID=2675880 RepID=A0A395ML58_9HYPO|nr:hypothetical protein FIE12Z_7384 [Fusarium flagelliforme]
MQSTNNRSCRNFENVHLLRWSRVAAQISLFLNTRYARQISPDDFITVLIAKEFRRRTMSHDEPLALVTPERFRAEMLRVGDPGLIAQVDAYFTARKHRSTFNTKRKRNGDGSIAKQPAKRQSNVVASSNYQSSTTARSKTEPELSQPRVVQPPVCLQSQKDCSGKELVANKFPPLQGVSHAGNQDIEEFKRRIAEYKSQLQVLEDEHASLSRDRDPETIKRLKTACDDATNRRQDFDKKLNTVDIIIKQMTKTIQDGHEMVPAQLHDALEASKCDHRKLVDALNKAEKLKAEQTQQLEEAERRYSEAPSKLEVLGKRMKECKLSLQSTEQDLNNVSLQRRLSDLSRINVSALPYDQRLLLSKLVGEIQAVLDKEPGASGA